MFDDRGPGVQHARPEAIGMAEALESRAAIVTRDVRNDEHVWVQNALNPECGSTIRAD